MEENDALADIEWKGGGEVKLYRVDIYRTMYVLARDEFDAERVAERNEREEVGNEADYCSSPAEATDVPFSWRDSIPYGGDQMRTVAQILTMQSDGTSPSPAEAPKE